MKNSRFVERRHAGIAAFFAKITRMVVGQAHDIETGVAQMCGIARRAPKQIAHAQIGAGFYRLPAIHQRLFEVAKSNICGPEYFADPLEERNAVIVGQVVQREIGPQHDIADADNQQRLELLFRPGTIGAGEERKCNAQQGQVDKPPGRPASRRHESGSLLSGSGAGVRGSC